MSQNGDGKLPVVCPRCGTHFSVKMPPVVGHNSVYISSIICAHEKLTKCFQCGQAFVLSLVGYEVSWQAQPVSDELVERVEGSKIITPAIIAPS